MLHSTREYKYISDFLKSFDKINIHADFQVYDYKDLQCVPNQNLNAHLIGNKERNSSIV